MSDRLRQYHEIPIGTLSEEDRQIMDAAYRQPVFHGPENMQHFAAGYLSLLAQTAGVRPPACVSALEPHPVLINSDEKVA